MHDKYEEYSREELLRLLRERDRKPRFGLVWERNEIEHDRSLNDDFVMLEPDAELSVGDAPHHNLVIEGDNFDALRYLRMTHAGKVKCIYIDPPYNTGNRDFIYNDRFVDKDDVYKHSKWLEYMYRRLILAKDLLAEDGVIFASIDDNEMLHLGMLMDQVFGEANRVATCIWQKRYSRENRGAIGDAHEYLLVYAITPNNFKERRNKIPPTEKQAAIYKNPNNDPKGPWRVIPMTAQGYRPNQMYEIITPTGAVHQPPEGRCWSTIESEFKRLLAEGRIWFGKEGKSQPGVIRYFSEVEGITPWTWWPHEEVGHTDEAKKEIQSILGTQTAFDTPKPVRLIERVLRIATKPDDLVLDFFAGSGTTAHAVMKLNAEDDGKRRFILVSSTEATSSEPDKNICRDVCAERLRRVIQGYVNKKGEAVEGLDGSFSYLRARRIPAARVFNEIQHGQVWLTLQLIHGEALAPYDETAKVQVSGSADARLMYVPKLNAATLKEVAQVAALGGSLTVYSWQPGQLRQRIEAGNVTFEKIPEFLVKRFGGGK
ncbi:site-specific DNA-methyltransferase [Thiobacillus sp. 0-1251]|jgi:adenine-specific DNA-methyltransferase|uniref:site-specific DNA-methyltransferase n=1 Tax=Thiobacillus sp. 0-1251 TaxID=1895858 RepID=UPI00095FBCFD|nr:site-specific DNA-methyltransferase [Thiobacillus sp. 0-1251]MDZ7584002.1 site-specific DNA-methyltransferase [Thiobacillus sp.]OJY58053.1 MAG: site-specific DNA-methyltransferase [Thiobacillus sp. 0-1251]